jgi:hypothetical protein
MDLRANGSGESGGDVEEDDGEGDGGYITTV